MADGTIVPPFMDDKWRAMRKHLHAAGTSAEAAAMSSTLEDVEHHTALAYAELHRADFLRESIERKSQ